MILCFFLSLGKLGFEPVSDCSCNATKCNLAIVSDYRSSLVGN
jgi:hypothetical protein